MRLPALVVPGVIFPGAVMPLQLAPGRPRTLVTEAIRHRLPFAMAPARAFEHAGSVVSLVAVREQAARPSTPTEVVVECVGRIRSVSPHPAGHTLEHANVSWVRELDDTTAAGRATTMAALRSTGAALIHATVDPAARPGVLALWNAIEGVGPLADLAVANLDVDDDEKLALLQELDVQVRLDSALALMAQALAKATQREPS